MSIKNDWNSVPPLENAIDPNPLIVFPDRPLDQVIQLMSQPNAENCLLPGLSSKPSPSGTGSHRCVLVIDNQELVGIFTERDAIEWMASHRLDTGTQTSIGQVMQRDLITLTKTARQDIFAALSLLREHQIRYLPVVNIHGRVIGIVTPETIRACVQPANLLQWRMVKDVMIAEVFYVPDTQSVEGLIDLMAKQEASCVVITAAEHANYSMSNGAPTAVGMITEQEILQCQVHHLDLSQTMARDIMSTPVLAIAPNQSLWMANQKMQQHQTRRLVVCGDRGELLGLLTHNCILRVFDVLEMSSVIEGLQQSVAQQTIALTNSNQQLQAEIAERQRTEDKLQELNQELENRVSERTIALQASNDELIAEIIRRKQVQEALRESQERLWSLIQTAGSVIIFSWPRSSDFTVEFRSGTSLWLARYRSLRRKLFRFMCALGNARPGR
jgi:CBS domain-containing protein